MMWGNYLAQSAWPFRAERWVRSAILIVGIIFHQGAMFTGIRSLWSRCSASRMASLAGHHDGDDHGALMVCRLRRHPAKQPKRSICRSAKSPRADALGIDGRVLVCLMHPTHLDDA